MDSEATARSTFFNVAGYSICTYTVRAWVYVSCVRIQPHRASSVGDLGDVPLRVTLSEIDIDAG